MQKNEWTLSTADIHDGFFRLETKLSETRVVIHSQIRLLEVEERVRNRQANSQEDPNAGFLSDHVDKDDIMRRLSENINDEKYLKMFSMFYVAISKTKEETAVLFQCKSMESDIIIDYVCTIPAADIDDYRKVVKTANLYRGVESMMLDENFRIGLHEYLKVHGVDEDLCTVLEHLAVVLRKKAVEQTITRIKEFALEVISS